MSDLLFIYEEDYKKIQSSINKTFTKISDYFLDKSSKLKDINEEMNKLENLIVQQQQKIKQIEIQISSSSKEEDLEGYNSKISSYKQSLELNKKKFRQMEEKANLKEASDLIMDKTDLQGNLINNEKLAYSSNQKMQQAKRVLAETEDMGNNIMIDMEKQSNTMKNTNSKLKGMNIELNESNSILNKMKARVKRNKNIIKILSLFLILILIIVCIYKIWKANKKIGNK